MNEKRPTPRPIIEKFQNIKGERKDSKRFQREIMKKNDTGLHSNTGSYRTVG